MVLYNKIETLVSQLLFAMLCCGALFVNSNNYTDNYIMPKLLVSTLLASIIIIKCIMKYQLKVIISKLQICALIVYAIILSV